MTSTNYNLQAMTDAMNREADMTDIKTEVNQYAEDAIKDAAMLSLVGQHGIVAGRAIKHYELDTDQDWIELLNIMALEVYGRATVRPGQSPLIEQIVVVTGTGGPHVEFEVDMDDNVTGRAIWGSNRAEKFDTMPGLFDLLAPLVEGTE